MFAYCGNNPISRCDTSGRIWQALLVGAALGAVAQYLGDVVNNLLHGATGFDAFAVSGSLGDYAAATVSGAFCAIPGAGLGVAVACDILEPMVQQGVDYVVGGTPFDKNKYTTDMVTNLVCEGFAEHIKFDAPEFIRDIKDEAYELGKKGTRALQSYLDDTIAFVDNANEVISMGLSPIAEFFKGCYETFFSKS